MVRVCPFSHPDSALHAVVRAILADAYQESLDLGSVTLTGREAGVCEQLALEVVFQKQVEARGQVAGGVVLDQPDKRFGPGGIRDVLGHDGLEARHVDLALGCPRAEHATLRGQLEVASAMAHRLPTKSTMYLLWT